MKESSVDGDLCVLEYERNAMAANGTNGKVVGVELSRLRALMLQGKDDVSEIRVSKLSNVKIDLGTSTWTVEGASGSEHRYRIGFGVHSPDNGTARLEPLMVFDLDDHHQIQAVSECRRCVKEGTLHRLLAEKGPSIKNMILEATIQKKTSRKKEKQKVHV